MLLSVGYQHPVSDLHVAHTDVHTCMNGHTAGNQSNSSIALHCKLQCTHLWQDAMGLCPQDRPVCETLLQSICVSDVGEVGGKQPLVVGHATC